MERPAHLGEDATPAYGIDVDFHGLAEFAEALRTELESAYTPHRELVNEDMVVAVPAPDERFHELCHTLDRHFVGRLIATSLLTEHGNACGMLAAAANAISSAHAEADARAVLHPFINSTGTEQPT